MKICFNVIVSMKKMLVNTWLHAKMKLNFIKNAVLKDLPGGKIIL